MAVTFNDGSTLEDAFISYDKNNPNSISIFVTDTLANVAGVLSTADLSVITDDSGSYNGYTVLKAINQNTDELVVVNLEFGDLTTVVQSLQSAISQQSTELETANTNLTETTEQVSTLSDSLEENVEYLNSALDNLLTEFIPELMEELLAVSEEEDDTTEEETSNDSE